MNAVTSSHGGLGDGLKAFWGDISRGRSLNRGATWGLMIIGALLAFEIFNYSTTQFALQDVLGDLSFAGLRWATILAIAFCSIDFAGIARIFTPQQGHDEPAEVWYLFGAWLLAAAFNAALTWWGVSVAIANHSHSAGTEVVSSATMTRVVPILVAAMVWLIRVLIIGTFSVAGDRLFSTGGRPEPSRHFASPQVARPLVNQGAAMRSAVPASRFAREPYHPAPKPAAAREVGEPSYHPVPLEAASPHESAIGRRLQ